MPEIKENIRHTFKKLSHPTWKETIKLTLIVILISAITAIILLLVDTGMTQFLNLFM